MLLENKSIYFEEHAKNLLQIIKRKDFGLAKWEIAEKTIYPRVAMLNFYGNDFTVVIRPVLQDIFTQDMFYRNALVGFARYQKMQLK